MEKDRGDASVKGLVIGMHRALPNSFSCGHGMNESAQSTESGRLVYRALLKWSRETRKPVSVVASHSHFVMSDLYDTPYWNDAAPGDRGVLPGWIAGTAGAVRYALPKDLPSKVFAKTGVYGYLLGEAGPDGKTTFSFREVKRGDVPADVVAKFGEQTVDECFSGNADMSASPELPASCSDR
jgi:hypothetical protein